MGASKQAAQARLAGQAARRAIDIAHRSSQMARAAEEQHYDTRAEHLREVD